MPQRGIQRPCERRSQPRIGEPAGGAGPLVTGGKGRSRSEARHRVRPREDRSREPLGQRGPWHVPVARAEPLGGGALVVSSRARRSCEVLAAVVMLWACGGNAALQASIDRASQRVLDAEQSGAGQCAPRELAIARSQLEFAELELSQGDAAQAARHAASAEEHAVAAKLLSPPEHCAVRSAR